MSTRRRRRARISARCAPRAGTRPRCSCASSWRRSGSEADKLRARGETPAKDGPSPGIRDLRWLKPVYAGDTISFAREVMELRETTRRPGWGLMVARNTGTNQHGELVLSFMGAKFAERRKET